MQTAPAKSQHMEEVTALTHRLVEIVSEQQTHQVGLEALMHEASAEQQREQQLRTGPRAATTHGPASVAALVQQAQPATATRPAPAAAQPGTSPTVRAMREHIAKTKGQQ